jgi:hypothetical protein
MNRRRQILLLSGLLVLLLIVGYAQFRSSDYDAPTLPAFNGAFSPLPVENPALRLDLLDRLKKFEYQGSHRNIFTAALPPPPAPSVPVASAPKPTAPAPPPGPPPLVVPATFFGYVTDARTGSKRAFFNDGEDVYVVAVGETLLGRFRLVQLGNNTAQVQETATGRTTTLTMTEEPGQGPS